MVATPFNRNIPHHSLHPSQQHPGALHRRPRSPVCPHATKQTRPIHAAGHPQLAAFSSPFGQASLHEQGEKWGIRSATQFTR
jgi:hypothetical protein